MKKKYIISLVALLMFSITGCDEEFLEVQPTQFLTEQQIAEAAEITPMWLPVA